MRKIFFGLILLIFSPINLYSAEIEEVYCVEPINLAKVSFHPGHCPSEWQRVPKKRL